MDAIHPPKHEIFDVPGSTEKFTVENYNNAYAYGAYNSCDLYGFSYAPTLASRYFQTSNIIAALRQRGRRT